MQALPIDGVQWQVSFLKVTLCRARTLELPSKYLEELFKYISDFMKSGASVGCVRVQYSYSWLGASVAWQDSQALNCLGSIHRPIKPKS